jgi:hypothetical protein
MITVVVGIACGAHTACSPYAFSDKAQAFSTTNASIDSSYQDNAQKIVSEAHLRNRIIWVRDKTRLAAGDGCTIKTHQAPSQACDLRSAAVTATAIATKDSAADPVRPKATSTDVCEAGTNAPHLPTTSAVKASSPLQTAQMLRAVKDYAAALSAVTKAQDRADFDNAAAKVSSAVEGLVKSAPPPYSGVAPVAKASANAVLWLVGQDLDYRRLQQLRNATEAACEPVRTLAAALAVPLEQQRGDRLDGLYTLLTLRIQAVNRARTNRHVTDEVYGSAIDDAQAAADAFQIVRITDPEATVQALRDAHDALVVAVRNNDGQFDALIGSLQAFQQQATGMAAAAGVSATPSSKNASPSTKNTKGT